MNTVYPMGTLPVKTLDVLRSFPAQVREKILTAFPMILSRKLHHYWKQLNGLSQKYGHTIAKAHSLAEMLNVGIRTLYRILAKLIDQGRLVRWEVAGSNDTFYIPIGLPETTERPERPRRQDKAAPVEHSDNRAARAHADPVVASIAAEGVPLPVAEKLAEDGATLESVAQDVAAADAWRGKGIRLQRRPSTVAQAIRERWGDPERRASRSENPRALPTPVKVALPAEPAPPPPSAFSLRNLPESMRRKAEARAAQFRQENLST